MTRDEWVAAALEACVEQGFTVAIEDPEDVAFFVDLLSRVRLPPTAGPSSP